MKIKKGAKERKFAEKTSSKTLKNITPLAEQEIILFDKGKSLIVNRHAIDLTMEEQPPSPKRAKLAESMMENIIVSYPEGISFRRSTKYCVELLYQIVTRLCHRT